jgi:hypothetical protein
MMMVSSKHFVLDPISLYRSSRYIGLEIRQERISIYLICNRDGLGHVPAGAWPMGRTRKDFARSLFKPRAKYASGR